jgi:diguanylate cyclase (GGDEF)-like protein
MKTIRGRILILFSTFAFMAFILIYLTSRGTWAVNRILESMVSEDIRMVQALGKMESSLMRKVSAMNRYLVSGDTTWLEVNNAERIDFLRWEKEARASARSEAEQVIFDEIADLYNKFLERNRQLIRIYERGHLFSRVDQNLIRLGDDYIARIQSRIGELSGVHEGIIQAQEAEAREKARSYARFTEVYLLVVVFFGLFLEFYLVRYMLRPLTLLVEGIRNFTRGHMNVQIPPVGKDEMGELQEAFNEMSKEIASERVRLATQSSTDPMTGLFNVRRFRGQLTEEFFRARRYGRPLSLMMIDVDFFKTYNDKNGHPAGDELLKEIARILQRSVRGTDLAARYGGEEFVVLLLETGLASARVVAEKVRKIIAETPFPFREKMPEGRVSVSIGVSAYPDSGPADEQNLISIADRALYAAKAEGRNRVCVVASPSSPRATEQGVREAGLRGNG